MNLLWSCFESRYAIGSDRGTPQTVPWEEVDAPFAVYVQQHLAFAAKVLPKDRSPGIIHGKTNGFRGARDVQSCTALVLDCDAATEPPFALIASLRGAYLCQWRRAGDVVKWHLVLPLAKPLTPEQTGPRRLAAIKWYARVAGVELDPSSAFVSAMLHPYCRRDPSDEMPTTWSNDGPFLDLDAILDEAGFTDWIAQPRQPRASGAEATTILEAIEAAGLFLDVPRRAAGRPITCPFAPHRSGDTGPTATIVTDTGYIKCFHGGCQGRSQAEFLSRLPLKNPARLRVPLSAGGERVTVEAAGEAIGGVLAAAKPFRGDGERR